VPLALSAMTVCPSPTFVIDPVTEQGPAGFNSFRVTQTSKTDDRCREVNFAMLSRSTNQILLAAVFPLASDGRPLEARIRETADKVLEKKTSVSISQTPLADGLRKVIISSDTPFGPLRSDAFIDSSNRFLMAGRLLDKTQDPRRQLLKAVGADSAARKGAKGAVVEILEISDFQCPSCGNAHGQMEPFLKKYPGKISYARMDLPFFEHHDWAIHAALTARALQRSSPAKYWPFVDFVFSNQEAITAKNVEAKIREFLADNDVDWKTIEPVYRSKEEKRALLDQIGRFYDNEVFATPTFVVNGQRVFYSGNSDFMFKYIETLLAGSAKAK